MITRIRNYMYRNWPSKVQTRQYHGQKVYLPRAGYSDLMLRDTGVYERENSDLFCRLAQEGTWAVDVGTNLGLMALPVLVHRRDVRVLSFEPSQGALRFLRRTHEECEHKARWELVTKCLGAKPGSVTFTLSEGVNIEYDGMRHTRRVGAAGTCEVEVTTLDHEWRRIGCPCVSVIKCDVEGAELGVLEGGVECLTKERPFVLMEWNEANFSAYGVSTAALWDLVSRLAYEVYSSPHLIPVRSPEEMAVQMLVCENFLLVPRETPAAV
ncbi:FkbM family methyltransferase [Prosthecobacter sp.]|uniref:FkbM family methyltransferase n=1 Tax=Prosthecobacter sp. TaxID=1965333 RepID=UPI001D2B7089|nr:FkbM family methyltransferase [Prosthecobacter sp.]MCB1276984.1 FkbM family methyltransferase [Prosthecobacter sp.]